MIYIFGPLQHQGKIWQKLWAILMDRFGDLNYLFRVESKPDFELRLRHMIHMDFTLQLILLK